MSINDDTDQLVSYTGDFSIMPVIYSTFKNIKLYDVELNSDQVTERQSNEFGFSYPVLDYKRTVVKNIPHQILKNANTISFEGIYPSTTICKFAFVSDNIWYKLNGDIIKSKDISVGDVITNETQYDLSEISSKISYIPSIVIGMMTSDSQETPKISSIIVNYNGYNECTSSEIKNTGIDNYGLYSIIENISGDTINDIVAYTINVDFN